MAAIIKEVLATSPDGKGVMAKATHAIDSVAVNITAFCAFSRDRIAQLHFVTDNNERAMESLNRSGFETKQVDVVITTLVHRVGSLDIATQRLADAGLEIYYSYATVAGATSLVIFATDNNKKAVELLAKA